MTCRIDHIVVTAPSLEAGSDFVHARLGVRPQPGGEHPRMGTHNLLLRLGDALFLEVIAVDPLAERPARARWFELDALSPAAAPRLACWVARTEDIAAAAAGACEPLGAVEPMTRGALEWLITIPPDGSLALGGVAPALIQWRTERHPALGLKDPGCRLVALQLLHPEPARARALLDGLGVAEPGIPVSVARAGAPGLVASFETPLGLRTI